MVQVKWVLLAASAAAALALTGIVAAGRGPFGGGPEQPIAFSHRLHADALQMPCQYCHFSASRSPDAGIPPVSVCAGCHLPTGQLLFRQDSPELQKLAEYWERKEPIPWVRVYDLPDHAHFPHMLHVNGGLECQECHGQVQEMAVVEQVPSLQMGWCLDCHQQRNVRIDCTVCHY